MLTMMYEVKLVRTVIEERVLLVEASSSHQARQRACAVARGASKPRDDEHEGEWEPRHIAKNHVMAVLPVGGTEET